MSLKNPVTPLGIGPGTVRLVAQRLNHYATPGPRIWLTFWLVTKAVVTPSYHKQVLLYDLSGSCKWHWLLTPYNNLLDFISRSEEWWSFSIPYVAIHDYHIASLDSQISGVVTLSILRNLGYFICTFILSVTFTFCEKRNWQKKVSCEEKAKQQAEIGNVYELRVLFICFVQPVRPVSDSIQDTGRSQNFVC